MTQADPTPRRGARIDLAAFRHNVRLLSNTAAPAATMLAVKANAYGHGLIPLALAALDSGATSLGVLDIPAALDLRRAGITAPIFAWMHAPDARWRDAIDADIDLGISALWQLDAIAASGAATAPRVHLKVDTGLSRNGANERDWPFLVARARELDAQGIVRLHGAWSHLADASPEDDAIALGKLLSAIAVAEEAGAQFTQKHLAASSAGIRMPEARLDLVRFGIAAYGISPFDDETALELGLRPVMSLVAPVALTKRVPAGHAVSYGSTYRTSAETTLALVPLGYADGIPRTATGRAEVLVAGKRFPIAGRIAMDQFVVDVGDHPVAPGDEVIVFGNADAGEPTAEEWAEYAGTIGDEIVARIGKRVPRRYEERYEIATPDDMHAFGVSFASRLNAGDTVILTGPLGAGKTTLSRGIGEGLGVRGPVTSPTFVLARTHPSLIGGPSLVHVDAYRLNNAVELDDLDLDFAGSVVLAEWGAGFVEELTDSWLEITIERPLGVGDHAGAGADDSDSGDEPIETRIVRIIPHGPRWLG